MALSGTLGDFSLTDILQLIGLQRKTGVLVLRRGEEEVTIGFDNGRVVSAESNRRAGEHKIGQLLVRTGKLTEERLTEAVRRQKATLQRLGHVLVENNWVDKDTVRRQLLLQITETIYDLFRWKDGEYDFQPNAHVEWDRGYIEPIPSENLLMEGARMVDEWPLIERVIPHRAVVLRSTERGAKLLAMGTDAQEARGSVYEQDIDFGFIPSDPMEEAGTQHKRLSDQERAVLRWIDGHRTVGEITELSGLGTFDTFHTLAELVEANLLQPVSTEPPAPARGMPALLRAAAPARVLAVAVGALALFGALGAVQEVVRSVAPAVRLLPASTPLASGEALSSAAGLENLRAATSAARISRLEQAVTVHFLDQGTWPRSLAEVAQRGLVPAFALRDPWGVPYAYEIDPHGFRIAEAGGRANPQSSEHRFTPVERQGVTPEP